jgi:hypothetical protein
MIDYTLSSKIKTQYKSVYPFPHIIIDNFFDENILNKSLEELKSFEDWGFDHSQRDMEVNKFMTPWCSENLIELENAAPISRYILDYLNSPEVLKFLSELTGIENLIPDNTFFGGGIHKISKGGKLAVHADYSFHRNTGHHRRINLLLYLNKNWQSEWNGNLELWSPDMSKKIADIEPLFNRAVIFNITNDALHGHPKPLNTPENVDRYSFALYYFTENRPKEEIERNLRDGDQSSVLWVETPEETVKRDLDLDSIFKV